MFEQAEHAGIRVRLTGRGLFCAYREAAQDKAEAVIEKLTAMRLKEAAQRIQDGIAETLTYYSFPASHWRRIRTNNPYMDSSRKCSQ